MHRTKGAILLEMDLVFTHVCTPALCMDLVFNHVRMPALCTHGTWSLTMYVRLHCVAMTEWDLVFNHVRMPALCSLCTYTHTAMSE